MSKKFAERLEILDAVGRDLLKRTAEFQSEVKVVNLSDTYITDKIAKRLKDFPEAMLKEKDPGYEAFTAHSSEIQERWSPLYELVMSIAEFRDASFTLICEVSGTQSRAKLRLAMLVFNNALSCASSALSPYIKILDTPPWPGADARHSAVQAHAVCQRPNLTLPCLQLSSDIVKFALDLNASLTRRYFGLAVIYAKLLLLLAR